MMVKWLPMYSANIKVLYILISYLSLVPDRPPKDITVVSIGTDTVQVDWSPVPPEYTNGKVLGYKVLYRDVNDTSRANRSLVSPKETHSRISRLKANTNYSFQVLAFTAKGNGVKSEAYFASTFQGIQDIVTLDALFMQCLSKGEF